jgi:uncharacterized membrane protein YgdD (TMEM256/DUF423 family)
MLEGTALDTWETAARYQMYHGLTLVIVGHRLVRRPSRLLRNACRFFGAGVVLFSGSLYALALTGSTWLGAITPLGGVALLLGWGCFAAAVLRPVPHFS